MKRRDATGRQAVEEARTLVAATAQAKARNRRQKWLFALMTVAITLAGLAAVRYFARPTTLVFAVAPAGGPEQAFAEKLAALVAQQSWRARVRVTTEETHAHALARFAQGKADLAIARTDMRIPTQARALALLDRAALVIAAPKASKLKSPAALASRKVALVSTDPRDAVFVRKFFEAQDIAIAGDLDVRATDNIAGLFEPGGPAAVVALERRSRLARDRRWEAAAQKPGIEVLAVGGAKALERRLPGAKEETIEAGALSAAPRVPAEDVDSMELEELLVVRAKIASMIVSPLAELILENREALGQEGVFAAAIEAPDVEKDARVLAHPGAADYVNGEVQTIFDRYGDLFYIGAMVGGGVGSMFVALYTALTRVQPVSAGQLTPSLMEAARALRAAGSLEELAHAEGALDAILEETLDGLREGSVSTEGFDGFRLAYERAREIAAGRRAALEAGGAGA